MTLHFKLFYRGWETFSASHVSVCPISRFLTTPADLSGLKTACVYALIALNRIQVLCCGPILDSIGGFADGRNMQSLVAKGAFLM